MSHLGWGSLWLEPGPENVLSDRVGKGCGGQGGMMVGGKERWEGQEDGRGQEDKDLSSFLQEHCRPPGLPVTLLCF